MLTFKRLGYNVIEFSGPSAEVQVMRRALASREGQARIKNWRRLTEPHISVAAAILPWECALLPTMPAVGEEWTTARAFDEAVYADDQRWADWRDEQGTRRAAARGVM